MQATISGFASSTPTSRAPSPICLPPGPTVLEEMGDLVKDGFGQDELGLSTIDPDCPSKKGGLPRPLTSTSQPLPKAAAL
jgi:hypothetical protein